MDFDKLRTLPAMTQEEFDRIQERILELASGEIKGGHMSNLEEMVFQALGEASMCWSERPKGVFDSDHAKEVGHKLVADIKHFYATANAPTPTANPPREKRGIVAMPNPTPEQVNDPMFLAIWEVIKRWDVNVPEYYSGYCGATGSHVMLIFNALQELWRSQ